jgi:hypothetical protein
MNIWQRLIRMVRDGSGKKPRRTRRNYRPTLEPLEDRYVLSTSNGSIAFNFNGTPIASGDTLWFSSAFKVNGLGANGASFQFTNDTISFTANGTSYLYQAPNASVTLSPSVTSATTSYDAASNTWTTMLPMKFSGNGFIDGVAIPLTSPLPGGIKNVTWQGQFTSSASGLSINWQWSAAVYKTFGTDYNAVHVKPVDDNHVSAYANSDHAGTPEAFLPYVTGGATGGGGSNFTGSLSSTQQITPATTGSLSGFVTDTAGNPLEGVVLTLTNSSGQTFTAMTDRNGFYQFTGLLTDTYSITITPPSGDQNASEQAGSLNGDTSSLGTISNINVGTGNNGTNYNFQEQGISAGG